MGCATTDGGDYVAQCGSLRRTDYADGARIARKGFLAFGGKQSVGTKLLP
jgi:hypothetical protein